MPKFKKWDLIEINWVDSYMMHGWTPLNDSEIDVDHSLDHRSIGYYVGETNRQISIVQSSKTFEDFISESETQVCGIFTIPKKAITKIRKLTYAKV